MISESSENRFLPERIENLYHQPLANITLFQLLMVVLATWYLWTPATKTGLLTWLGIRIIVSFSTILIVKIYRKHSVRENNSTWLYIFIFIAFVNSLLWSMLTLLPNVLSSVNNIMFIGIMLLGVVAAALPVMSNFFFIYAGFSVITLSPLIIYFLTSSENLYNIFGIMFLVYLGVQFMSSYNMQKVLINSFKLNIKNIHLVDVLQEKNQQAEDARELAEKANLAKSKFLAAASHDLRQPMHALGLFVSKIYNNNRYPEIYDDIENIKESSDALDNLLNSLLDISKLDAGVLKTEITTLPLQGIFNRVATTSRLHAEEKSLAFYTRPTKAIVSSDPVLLERILNNLVSNAIRYTNEGTIHIGCRRRGDNVRIEIRDTGIGISEENLSNIFEEFYQAGNSERNRSKGLGLGLAIVKRLCTLLGYPVDVRSTPGVGSLFAVEIPCLSNTEDPGNTVMTTDNFVSDISNMSVLVIDDEEIIRKGMATLLSSWHCKYLLADSAGSAIIEIKESGFVPDIIITDYRLRDNRTGADAIQQIEEILNKKIPAIIVTGDTAPDKLKEVNASGYQLLHKPVSPAKLRSVMSFLRDKNTG